MSERILDIGIGTGGEYIRKDDSSIVRIGMDLDENEYVLQWSRKEYGIPVVRATADLTNENGILLPFADNTFKGIDVLFPHDGLLFGLCRSEILWSEFNRILIPEGLVNVVLDTNYFEFQSIDYNEEPITLSYPQEQIDTLARKSGLITRTWNLTPQQTRNYDTQFSSMIANRQEELMPTQVFHIQAHKQT